MPLNDLGAGTHLGSQGGLYPDGSNQMPTAHAQAGLEIAQTIQPLSPTGQVDEANGRIVLLSIGMSNTSQEFIVFISQDDPLQSNFVQLVNGAQGGKSAEFAANPNDDFWTTLDQRLADSGVTAQQVQVIWLKQARANADTGEQFPTDAAILQDYLRDIVQIAQSRFPNLKIAYLFQPHLRWLRFHRTSVQSQEAYQSGFAVKWLIEDQMNGEPALNYDPAQGSVMAPWLAWGPYLWADGLTPRSDGLIWLCSDFIDDGTHPSGDGAAKVAGLLQDFFRSEGTAVPWYLDLSQLPFKQFVPLIHR